MSSEMSFKSTWPSVSFAADSTKIHFRIIRAVRYVKRSFVCKFGSLQLIRLVISRGGLNIVWHFVVEISIFRNRRPEIRRQWVVLGVVVLRIWTVGWLKRWFLRNMLVVLSHSVRLSVCLPLLRWIAGVISKTWRNYIHAHWYIDAHRRKHTMLLRIDMLTVYLSMHRWILRTSSSGITHRMHLTAMINGIRQWLLTLVVETARGQGSYMHCGWKRGNLTAKRRVYHSVL